MRRSGLVLVILSITTTAFAACASDSAGESVGEAAAAPSATSAGVPTFTRVTVTPVPIDTPVPTSTPEPVVSKITDEQLADPIFPDWLDPELNDEQPEDEVVFEGWREFLTNTVMEYVDPSGATQSVNFCDDGVVFNTDGTVNSEVTWGATRTASMSSRQWGKIAMTATFLLGENQGRTFTFFVVSREDGKVMQTGWGPPVEMKITRSTTCLEMFPPDNSEAAVHMTGDAEVETIREFPSSIDPASVTEQPTDEAILAGWTADVTDGLAYPEGYPQWGQHFCADGSFWWPTSDAETFESGESVWEVKRNPAISSSEWQTVRVGFLDLSREDGMTVRKRERESTVMHVTTSQLCLDRIG